MRQPRLPAALRLILAILTGILLATWVDPHVVISSPLEVQLINAVIPVIVMLLAWGVSGRAWLALLVEMVLLCVLRYADHVKLEYLNSELVYADLTVIGGLLTDPRLVLGFVHPTTKKIIGAVALLVVVSVTCLLMQRQRTTAWPLRLTCLLLAVAGLLVFSTQHAPDVVPSLKWDVYAQAQGANSVGITGNLLLGRMTARDVRRPPDRESEQAFWKEPLVQEAERQLSSAGNGNDMRPDIIIVQSESLFEPSQLCGFADTPILKHVAEQQPDLPGNLHVPVFGGRTLQTEFEVLTGAPISYYPGSMFSYYELVRHRFDALPHVLDDLSYKTLVLHPNNRGFWRRGIVMPDMGFDTFQDIDSFLKPRDFTERGHVSDGAMTRAILSELDSSSRPTFVMAISMNNHGPWGDFAPKDDSGLGLPSRLTGDARAEMADYVSHAIDADKAYGYLLNALKRRGRPAIVLFYGDHLPALSEVYKQLCFKDGKGPEDHYPPYRIWANFPMPKPPGITSAYLLQGWLMHVAGLPLKSHELADALAGLVAQNPDASAADRTRVLDEYANIAAANVASRVPADPDEGNVYIGSDQALDILLKKQVPIPSDTGAEVSSGDLLLTPIQGAPAKLAFDTQRTVSSLTLRFYLDTPCTVMNPQSKTWVSVGADGHELYRAYLGTKTFRLATLDVRGARRISVRAKLGDPGACQQVHVRVAQMNCYSAQCQTPAPASVHGDFAESRSRILTNDPMPGDIAALGSMESARAMRRDTRMENMEWMIGREKASQQGAAPFQVQVNAQLFMHPAMDHDAWIDFDVKGLDTIRLRPRINTLDKACSAMNSPGEEAGVVGLNLQLDGRPLLPRMIIDRYYDKTLTLDVTNGHTMRVDVDKGNKVTSCDWFSVGVPSLTGASAP